MRTLHAICAKRSPYDANKLLVMVIDAAGHHELYQLDANNPETLGIIQRAAEVFTDVFSDLAQRNVDNQTHQAG